MSGAPKLLDDAPQRPVFECGVMFLVEFLDVPGKVDQVPLGVTCCESVPGEPGDATVGFHLRRYAFYEPSTLLV